MDTVIGRLLQHAVMFGGKKNSVGKLYVAVMLQVCFSYVAVMLQLCLRHDFYNVIFKSKHKLSTASGPAPPNQIKKSGCAPATHCPAITVYVVTRSAGCT